MTDPKTMAIEATDAFLDVVKEIRESEGPEQARACLEATRDLLIRIAPAYLDERSYFYEEHKALCQLARARWYMEEHPEDEWEPHEVHPGFALVVIEGTLIKHTQKAIGFWREGEDAMWIPKAVMQEWEHCPQSEGSPVMVWPVQEWWIVKHGFQRRK